MHGVFEQVIGQSQAIELLTCAIQRDRLAPAYLFVGPPGVGRRLTAACFATWMLAKDPAHPPFQRVAQRNHPDLLWVEPTYQHKGKLLTVAQAEAEGLKRKTRPQIRLEQIREIGQFLSRPTLEAKRAVVVLEAAETMAEAAANGLLKTLEEPGNATLILLAPSTEALLPTLISRCQRIPFRRLSAADLATVLEQAGHGDILRASDVLALAQGSPGEAIAHWQQLEAIPAELLADLAQPPRSLKAALERAATINRTLDTDAQLWLVEYLQHRYWHSQRHPTWLHSLETVRKQLLNYAQPRLVWEVALMNMVAS